MTQSKQRQVNSTQFKRRKASEDTKRKILDWNIWECEDPVFRYDYDRTVSLFVHYGSAVLTFACGETVDLQAGDFLTINNGASATWTVSTPIRNSYRYHDSFESASKRSAQINWQEK